MGANAAKHDKFDTKVNMWVFEETVNGRKLTEIINTDHENVKYLPGHKLPPNVVSKKKKPSSTTDRNTKFVVYSLVCCHMIEVWLYFLSLHQVAVPDLAESVKGADILIFVVPHQFILRVCDTIKDHIKKDVVGMSLIKVATFDDETQSFLSSLEDLLLTTHRGTWTV